MKSPLRYPGGKSRAAQSIVRRFFPKSTQAVISPFLGGGSVELALAEQGTEVFASDAFQPLITFWNALLHDREALVEAVRAIPKMTPELFKYFQNGLRNGQVSGVLEAAWFFAINRSSFSGVTLCGGMSPGTPRFTESSMERLASFREPRLSVTPEAEDFETFLRKYPDMLAYCDPPYMTDGKLYGDNGSLHKDFDHERLRRVLGERRNWVLSYNDCPEVRELYTGFKILTPDWNYGMTGGKISSELIITG